MATCQGRALGALGYHSPLASVLGEWTVAVKANAHGSVEEEDVARPVPLR